jgi:hypothetical protein
MKAGKVYTMSNFTKLSEIALVEFNRNAVKKLYLQAVGTALMNCGKSVAIQYTDPATLKVTAEKIEELKKAFSFFASEYTPMLSGKNGMNETPAFFTVTRNHVVTPEGNTRKASENTASVNDRQRLGKGNGVYRWNPTGALIMKNTDTDCDESKKWIIKAASGKILGYCRVLNAEAWGFVSGIPRQ